MTLKQFLVSYISKRDKCCGVIFFGGGGVITTQNLLNIIKWKLEMAIQ